MRGLRHLGLGDILTLAGGIALGNAVTLLAFVALGMSPVPSGAGVLGLVSGYLVVVVGLTVLPSVLVFLLVYLSFRMAS